MQRRSFGNVRRLVRLAWGLGAAALYVAAAVGTRQWPVPPHLLYDGFVPPAPYHWVRPPAALARNNQPPQSGMAVIVLGPSGTAASAVATGDEQAVVVFPKDVIGPHAGDRAVEVRIAPLDPAGIAPPPHGLRYDGNAYRVTATYMPSRAPARLRGSASVVLRYATSATALLQAMGAGWTRLASKTVPIAYQIYGPTTVLGTFVAAGPPASGVPLSVWLYRAVTVLLWLAAAALAVALVRDYLRGRRGRRSRPPQSGT